MFRCVVRKDASSVSPVRESQLAKNVEAKGRTGGARDIAIEVLRFMLSAVRTSRLPCPRKLSRAGRNRGTPVRSYAAPTVADYCASTDLADWVILLAACAGAKLWVCSGRISISTAAARCVSAARLSA